MYNVDWRGRKRCAMLKSIEVNLQQLQVEYDKDIPDHELQALLISVQQIINIYCPESE